VFILILFFRYLLVILRTVRYFLRNIIGITSETIDKSFFHLEFSEICFSSFYLILWQFRGSCVTRRRFVAELFSSYLVFHGKSRNFISIFSRIFIFLILWSLLDSFHECWRKTTELQLWNRDMMDMRKMMLRMENRNLLIILIVIFSFLSCQILNFNLLSSYLFSASEKTPTTAKILKESLDNRGSLLFWLFSFQPAWIRIFIGDVNSPLNQICHIKSCFQWAFMILFWTWQLLLLLSTLSRLLLYCFGVLHTNNSND